MRSDIDHAGFAPDCAPVPSADFISAVLRTGFSPEAYSEQHGDLQQHALNATTLLGHYLRFGLRERRYAPLTLDCTALIELARLPLQQTDFKARLLSSLGAHLFEKLVPPFAPAITANWPVVRALAQERARPYFVAGDSHSHQFALTGTRGAEWLLPIHMICHGSSARGLLNPDSISGYGGHLRQAVETIADLPGARDTPILLQFGQVDIEFVYHFHRVRDGKRALDLAEYRAFAAETAARYIAFVTELFESNRRSNVHLVGVFPPAIWDEAWRDGYVGYVDRGDVAMSLHQLAAGIRELEIANLRQRTDIHAYYNDLLRKACQQHGFGFIGCFSPLLGSNGVVHSRYVIPERTGHEHHLDSRQTYPVMQHLLWDIMATR